MVDELFLELEIYCNDYSTPDGTCVRDYIHIKDLASAHVKAIEDDVYGEMNLGTGIGHSNKEIVDAVRSYLGGKDFNVIYAPRRPGDPDELVADPSFAQDKLGWKPENSSIDQIICDAFDFEMRKTV